MNYLFNLSIHARIIIMKYSNLRIYSRQTKSYREYKKLIEIRLNHIL
jgi:polyhydroxyalkanoate synthesis regulator protein